MNCDRCGQRVNEVPACEHRFVGQAADDTLRCTYCGHNFGPVRELIEKAGLWNLYGSSAGAAELIATLTRERDEARGESEQYKKMLHGNTPSKVQYNVMVDDVGAALGYVSWSPKTWSMLMNEIRQMRTDSARFVRERDEAVRERDEARKQSEIYRAAWGPAEGRIAELHQDLAKVKAAHDHAVKERDEQRRIASMIEDERTKAWVDLDTARARIAELENRVFNGRQIMVHANGTWEWRKV